MKIEHDLFGSLGWGGAFDVPGNMTFAAVFNWCFDPEASKLSVLAQLPSN